ncbi:transglutaminase-like superfamily protein [bacterium BMS3Bbin04]|nr:transglutaminase-like superfamily protein [bacterium BMS3Bbin04]
MRRHSFYDGLVLLFVAVLLMAAVPAWAQLERDRPTPPGEPEPVTVFSRVANAGTADDYDSGHVIVLDESVSRVMENGVTYVDLYTIYKVLTEGGAQTLSALEWHFDPRSSYVEVAEVNVIRDGERIPVDVGLILDLPAPQRSIYWSDRIKELQLPRLKVGDGIEVVAMRKGYNYALLADDGDEPSRMIGADQAIRSDDDDRYIPPMVGHYFDILIMQANVPVIEKRYTLVLPNDKLLQSQVYNAPIYSRTHYDEENTTYTWWLYDIPPAPHEPRMPGNWDISPKVVMTTAASWEQKSQWFFDVNKNQFKVTDDIREHVEHVLAEAGLKIGDDPMKVAEELNHWVAQNIRYSGQTMGEGEGFTLHPSDMLFEYRSGVCKDIASFSITLLRAAGLNVYPAMTMAGSTIEDIPADQFNHCVVAWEKEPGDFVMLDPTWVPFNNDIWSKLETEQQYVIGHPDGVGELQEIRYSPPEESPLNVVHTATLSEDGTLSGTIHLDGMGALDSRLRRIVYNSQKRALDEVFAGVLGSISDAVEIKSVKHYDIFNFDGFMWIEIEYEIPGYAMMVDGGLEFRPPVVNAIKDHGYLFRAGAMDWDEERTTDVFLYYTQRLDITETISLPRGFQLANDPSVDSVDETYASFSQDAEMNGRKLVLHSLTEVKRRQFGPEGYDGFKKAIDHLDDWAGTTVRVTKGGA